MAKSSSVVFKSYNPDQAMLLPPSLDELIPAEHPVRLVRAVAEQIDLDPLLKQYRGGGASSYDPRMMLKVIIYGYLSNIYSSRKLEGALQENIHFMWLSGMQQPDHNTLNRFRSQRLKGVIKQVFTQVVMLLVEGGMVDLQELYTDGTKLEANANRYTFVWGKAIGKSKERIARQLEELWAYAEKLAAEELKDSRPADFGDISPEQVQATIDQINKALQDKPASKKVKQKLRYAGKNWPANLKKYQKQEQILEGRNSYSKTDQDATFMRMKEDHMKNGQLKPGYNLQISTKQQFILHYSLHQKPTDTTTLIPHLQSFEMQYGHLPATLTADAGYGSEENYRYLEDNQVEAYVKYNYFDQEQKKGNKKKPFKTQLLHYNAEEDYVVCPMGQHMLPIGTRRRKTSTGYQQEYTIYQAANCQGCPLRPVCHSQKGDRKIEINHRLEAYKEAARKRLKSEEGLARRKQRPVDVESVFGMIKNNWGFRRFMLRTLPKVEIEAGLLALAHNIAKMAALHPELKALLGNINQTCFRLYSWLITISGQLDQNIQSPINKEAVSI
jgi:transposase